MWANTFPTVVHNDTFHYFIFKDASSDELACKFSFSDKESSGFSGPRQAKSAENQCEDHVLERTPFQLVIRSWLVKNN